MPANQNPTNQTAGEQIENIGISLEQAIDILMSELNGWFETAVENIPNAVVAALALIATYLVASLISSTSKRIYDRMFDSPALSNLFSTITKILVICLGFFIALDLLGLQKAVVSLLAGAGIIGLALGFAFQDLAENFLAGLMLAIRKPFENGDLIHSNDQFGFVETLNLRNTIIKDFDGQIIYIPNKEVFKNVLENYSKTGKRRISIQVGVSYGEDLDQVETILKKAIGTLDFTSSDKKVEAWALEYGDSSINFTVRYWIDFPSDKIGYLEATHKGVKAIKAAFDEEDILIPFPIRTLDFGIKGGEGLAAPLKEALSSRTKEEA